MYITRRVFNDIFAQSFDFLFWKIVQWEHPFVWSLTLVIKSKPDSFYEVDVIILSKKSLDSIQAMQYASFVFNSTIAMNDPERPYI